VRVVHVASRDLLPGDVIYSTMDLGRDDAKKVTRPGPLAGRHSDVLAFSSLVDPCRRLSGEVRRP